jgi:hypothetical protein
MTKLLLKDKALGMKVWKWYILLAIWAMIPLIHVIRGEMDRAFNLAMWMLVGALTGRAGYKVHMMLKMRRAKGFIHGYYMGRSTHDDGTVLYTRIPIVLPERSFDFRIQAARNQEEVAQLLIENLQEMHNLEPHLVLLLKSWVDDGVNYPPWASKEELEHIKLFRDENKDSTLADETGPEKVGVDIRVLAGSKSNSEQDGG